MVSTYSNPRFLGEESETLSTVPLRYYNYLYHLKTHTIFSHTKSRFVYSLISHHYNCSEWFTLYMLLLGRPAKYHHNICRKHSAMFQLMLENYLHVAPKYPPMPTQPDVTQSSTIVCSQVSCSLYQGGIIAVLWTR